MTDIKVEESRMPTPEPSPDELKDVLIASIMELTHDERKELLAMWNERKNNVT